MRIPVYVSSFRHLRLQRFRRKVKEKKNKRKKKKGLRGRGGCMHISRVRLAWARNAGRLGWVGTYHCRAQAAAQADDDEKSERASCCTRLWPPGVTLQRGARRGVARKAFFMLPATRPRPRCSLLLLLLFFFLFSPLLHSLTMQRVCTITNTTTTSELALLSSAPFWLCSSSPPPTLTLFLFSFSSCRAFELPLQPPPALLKWA